MTTDSAPRSPEQTGDSAVTETERIKPIIEAALLAAGRPLALSDLEQLFAGDLDAPPRSAIRAALAALDEDWRGRSLALQEVASGFRAQVREEFEPWLARLWDEKPPKYSRALLETLAIIAYRQPITRSEIEEIRGVSVSTHIMRTLGEREWVRVVGHRDAPGRPAMYGTTRHFLDHFNLKSLDQLPELSELDQLGGHPELEFEQDRGREQADAPETGIGAAVAAPTGDEHDGAGGDRAVSAASRGDGADDRDPAGASALNPAPGAGDERADDDQGDAEDPAAADTEDPTCTSVS